MTRNPHTLAAAMIAMSWLAVAAQPPMMAQAADSPSAAAAIRDSIRRPDWTDRVDQAPFMMDDTTYTIIKCGPFADPSLRDESMDIKMLATANRYIDDTLYRDPGVSDMVALDTKFVRQHCYADQWPTAAKLQPGEETLVYMRFDKRFRAEVEHRRRQFISLGRVQQAGGVAAIAVAVLAAAYTYLRATQKPTPQPQTANA